MHVARSLLALPMAVCLAASFAPSAARAAGNQAPVAVDDPAVPACFLSDIAGGSFPIPEDWIGFDAYNQGWMDFFGTCSPLANDTDPDGDPLTISLVGQPAHGQAMVIADPTGGLDWLLYKPDPDFSTRGGDQPGGTWDSDPIQYRACDATLCSNVATFHVWVAPVNDAPSFTPGPSTVTAWLGEGPVSVPWATDITPGPPNEAYQTVNFEMFAISTDGAPGMFAVPPSISPDGILTFTPGTEPGLATVTVDLRDDGGLEDYNVDSSAYPPPADTSPTVQFQIVVYATQPGAPVAASDVATVSAGTPTCIPVLANDSSPLGRPLSVTAVGTPSKGSAAVSAPDCGVLYTPDHGATGWDDFAYTVGDDQGRVAQGSVEVWLALPDPPIANDDAATVPFESTTCIPVVSNDSGPDFLISAHTDGAHGTVAVHEPDVSCPLDYTPDAGFSGEDAFTYTISDAYGQASTATVHVTVAAANSAPVAVGDSAAVAEGAVDSPIDVLTNDSDPDGDTLTIETLAPPSHGTAAIDGGMVSYTPSAGFAGQDAFGYTISDGHGHEASATVSVSVAPDAVPPAVGAISASLPAQTIGASTVSVRLSWTAADDVAGVAATELQMRRSGGAYTRVALAGPASTTALVTLVPGASYTFRVRAADARGNVSAWRTLGPFTAKLAQESTSGLARHGTWSRVTGSHLSGGASRRATSRGASVTFTFYGRSIAWVATRGTRGGRAQVRIDGVLVATVDTRTGSTTYRRTVFSRVLERRATHRIQITALGTGFVDVDAFLVLP